MTLTHDKVRSLRDVQARALHGCECQGNCICCGWATTAVALADEWLARRTVRWGDSDADERSVLSGPGFSGAVGAESEDDDTWWVAEVNARYLFSSPLATEAEARAWLEARAREAGFEIEGGRE